MGDIQPIRWYIWVSLFIGKQWIWRYPVFRQSVVYVSEIFIHGAHTMYIYIYIHAYVSIGHLGIARIYCELVQIVSSHEHGRHGPIACWLHLGTMWSSARLKIKALYIYTYIIYIHIYIYVYIYGYSPFKRSLGWNSWMDYTAITRLSLTYIRCCICLCHVPQKGILVHVAHLPAGHPGRYIWYTWPWVHPGQNM